MMFLRTGWLARRCGRLALLALIFPIAMKAASPVRAEVSSEVSALGAMRSVLMSGILDPDPIPRRVWRVDRFGPEVQALNPEGDARGDAPPDFALRAADGWPLFVWSAAIGSAQQVVYSEWTGAAWSPVTSLTSGPQDLDPRVFIDLEGTVYVVWWSEDPPARVWMISRQAGSSEWSAPEAVSGAGEEGRRPSVASFGGSLWVAYERPSQEPGVGVEVVLARRDASGPFVIDHTFATQQGGAAERADAILHVGLGRLWVDWKQSQGVMAYAARESSPEWTPPASRPWTDGSWIGTEMTRQLIRWTLLVH